ncbi:MAG: hypothetical protein E7480_01630 [Ruminococcaceae bacterium]|nr:hypothetical protein [Oscillospiraceae bacterium]
MNKLSFLNLKKEKSRLNLLIGYFWLMPVILSVFSGNIKLKFLGVNLFTATIYGVFLIFLLINFKHVFLKIKGFDILFLVFIALSITITMIVFPQNTVYIKANLFNWSFAFIYYLIGKLIARTVSAQEVIGSVSKLGIIISYIAYATTFGMTNKDMTFAYVVLTYVVMTANSGFNKNKVTDLYWCIAGLILIFILGTRGPLLFGVLYVLYRAFLKMGKGWKITVLSVAGISGALFVETNAYYAVLQNINAFLESRNIESYIIDQILSGNTSSDQMRSDVVEKVIDAIQKQPLGYGLFGDRVILKGSYVHNIIVELLCAYGVVLGLILLVLLGLFIYRAIRHSKYYNRTNFLIAFIFIYLMKFFVSSSILNDTFFGLFMGVFSFFYINERKRKNSM